MSSRYDKSDSPSRGYRDYRDQRESPRGWRESSRSQRESPRGWRESSRSQRESSQDRRGSSRERWESSNYRSSRDGRESSQEIIEELDDEVQVEEEYYNDYNNVRVLPPSIYSKEDQEALDNLYCRACDVKLHDPKSMLGHIRGKRHIAQKKNSIDIEFKRGAKRPLDEVKKQEFDDNFWTSAENDQRKRMYDRPEFAKVYDTDRYDRMKGKFDKHRYSFKKSGDGMYYCKPCGTQTMTRDVMESHLRGKEHIKNTKKANLYECELCSVQVPCQDTLEKHMNGSEHIKKMKLMKENQVMRGAESGSSMTVTQVNELERLKNEKAMLQRTVKDLQFKYNQCKQNHGEQEKMNLNILRLTAEKEELLKENLQLKNKISSLEMSSRKLKKDEEGEEYAENLETPLVYLED